MFCPKCKAEFREGFTRCVECGVDLINELPPEPKPQFVDIQEVFVTSNFSYVALAKSLLDAEKIPYHIENEHFSSTYGGIIPFRILVPREHIENAQELLKDLK